MEVGGVVGAAVSVGVDVVDVDGFAGLECLVADSAVGCGGEDLGSGVAPCACAAVALGCGGVA